MGESHCIGTLDVALNFYGFLAFLQIDAGKEVSPLLKV